MRESIHDVAQLRAFGIDESTMSAPTVPLVDCIKEFQRRLNSGKHLGSFGRPMQDSIRYYLIELAMSRRQ